MDKKDITVREATVEDYQAILDIDPDNEIYEGNDYVPAMFHSWIKDPHFTFNVLLINNKIVCLAIANRVDDGGTIVGMAARTHPGVRGKRIWSAMRSYEGLAEPEESVKNFAGVTGSFRIVAGKTEKNFGVPYITLIRSFRIYEFEPKYFRPLAAHNNTKVLSSDECLEYLRSAHVQWRLFPNKRIVCDPGIVVYKLMDANFHRIIRNREAITATVDSTAECLSMAFGSALEVHNSYQYSIHYYGNQPSDVTDLINHVTAHLQIAAKHQSKQPLHIRLFWPVEMPEPEICKAMSQVEGFKSIVTGVVPLAMIERNRKLKPPQAKL